MNTPQSGQPALKGGSGIAKKNQSKDAKAIKSLTYGCIGLGVLSAILLGSTATFVGKNSDSQQAITILNAKVEKLQQPIYNEVYDFLTDQCGKGAYCLSLETQNPSLELLKFLVNFREQNGQQYRLFFEVSAGKTNTAQPYKLSCDTQDATFYICQEISATNPTDVIRVFQKSYETLSRQATYTINLMVKPIGQINDPKPVRMQPNPNLVVTPMTQAADTYNIPVTQAPS